VATGPPGAVPNARYTASPFASACTREALPSRRRAPAVAPAERKAGLPSGPFARDKNCNHRLYFQQSCRRIPFARWWRRPGKAQSSDIPKRRLPEPARHCSLPHPD
jgi:hypothetical protein